MTGETNGWETKTYKVEHVKPYEGKPDKKSYSYLEAQKERRRLAQQSDKI